MRVPRRADGLVRRVVDWAELVEQEERVGDVGLDAAGEGSPHREPGALDGVVSGDDTLDGTAQGRRVGVAQAGKDEGVVDSDCRHAAMEHR